MNIRKCLARIIIPLSVVSAFAILLPFNVVYLNMKLIGKVQYAKLQKDDTNMAL